MYNFLHFGLSAAFGGLPGVLAQQDFWIAQGYNPSDYFNNLQRLVLRLVKKCPNYWR